MAEPFDSIAASVADVIDRLAKGEITETQAATALSPLLTAVNDGEFAHRVDEIVNVVGRITGLLLVEAPPSNTLGAPGSYAWDRLGKVFYGPKDRVTGWPAGDAMTEGPPGRDVELRKSATHVQWRVAGTTTWNNLIPLADLAGSNGKEVELQATATHIQWRLSGGAWTNLVALSELKGADGREISLQKTTTHIQWRLGTGAWADLVALADLQPTKATATEIVVGTEDGKMITPKGRLDALAPFALADAATVAIDLATGINFTLTLGGNRVLGVPANAKPGKSGLIVIKQDATGGRTLAFSTAWHFFAGVPQMSTIANAVDVLHYFVEAPGVVRAWLGRAAPKTYLEFQAHIAALATNGVGGFGSAVSVGRRRVTTGAGNGVIVGTSWQNAFSTSGTAYAGAIRHGMPSQAAFLAQGASGYEVYVEIVTAPDQEFVSVSRNGLTSSTAASGPALRCLDLIYWDGTQAMRINPFAGTGPTPYLW